MHATPTQQRNGFSEGLALGMILNGRRTLRYDKGSVDLAVTGAFRGWAYASSFPQVATDLRKGLDGVHALIRADATKRTFAFYWDTSERELVVVSRDPDWSEDEADDVTYALDMIGGGVPSEGWRDLGGSLLHRLAR